MKAIITQIKNSFDRDFGVYLDSEMIVSLHGQDILSTEKLSQRSFSSTEGISGGLLV